MTNRKGTKYRFGDHRVKRPLSIPKTCTPIICVNTGQEFPSIKAAAEWFGICTCVVINSARNKRYMETYKGLAFEYRSLF